MKKVWLDLAKRAVQTVEYLKVATAGMIEPSVSQIVKEYGRKPFLVLVSCLLSLRTKDTVSLPASRRLFAEAKTPSQILKLPIGKIEKLIYPVGFYRQKAINLHVMSKTLIETFGSKVPATEKELLSLKGVGRKTANLVLGEGFGIPAICVDTHVHRISNRLGLVKTRTPEETEAELKKILPKEYWRDFNRLLVQWGQNICAPISPFCSKCVLVQLCDKVGVTSSR